VTVSPTEFLGAAGTGGYTYGMKRSEPLGLVGPRGTARRMFLRSRATSIKGGTSEQRNIIGERILGIRREPRP